ncbi:class I SAM-dependent DNA methyltransferase [Thauera mechernichensis]
MTYALALDNPPLLVVSNRAITQIHTHFTGTPSETYTIRLEDIGTPENLQRLRWLFTDPEKFRPGRTVLDITADAAGRFADVAQSMAERGHDPAKVAHFLIQSLFCMFAEDIGLLPKKLFERVIAKRQGDPAKLAVSMAEMFQAMRTGGDFLLEDIAYFNGGLFEHVEVLELVPGEIDALLAASRMDWSAIEPSILGTLFERGLDPKIRAPLGANYTDPGTIMKLVRPVVVEPLEREWEAAKAKIGPLVEKYHAGGKGSQKAGQEAQALFLGYLERLKDFRVLDPACGSGNFLYLALRALKDLEHRANLDAEALGLHRQLTIETSPDNVRGIEINAYAAELARVTVWIGEIQWMLKHGYDCRRNPILARLDHIENRDALLNEDGSEAEWPAVDAIVGNPPFLGGSRKSGELGREYFDALNRVFADDVPGGADLVCYWFHKSKTQIESGQAKAAGLVSTNSIRGGANRAVLDSITAKTRIFEAWSDEPWVNDGAAVRVSLVAFGATSDNARDPCLNGHTVPRIHADLTAGEGLDLSRARALPENALAWAYGSQEKGKFGISEEEALALLKRPNPHACPNSDVIRRSVNARQIARRRESTWVIDFGVDRTLDQASLYEGPFAIVTEQVAPARLAGRDQGQAKRWWLHARPSPKYRAALAGLPRVIVTPCVSKHRLFAFLSPAELADHQLAVILRSDDTTFGVLHSRFHELWSLRLCTWLGVGNDPRYTPSTTFETFPFPAGMTPADTAAGTPTGPQAEAIAAAARRLNELRENWLNPAEWVDRIPEVVPGFPDRIIPKPGHEAELKKRTLTNLYNLRPAWLDSAHKALDAAVADAYGWADYTPEMPDDEVLRRLLALNLERAAGTR